MNTWPFRRLLVFLLTLALAACGGGSGSGSVQYTLSYDAGTGGAITGATSQVVSHGSDGSAVTAVPNAGYRFLQWSDDNPDATRTERNVISDIAVVASFVPLAAPTNVQASAGNEEVVISWDAVEGANGYSLYYATETIIDIGSYASYANGTLELNVVSPYTVSGLTNGTIYFFRVATTDNPDESLVSAEVTATPQVPVPGITMLALNDTGIDWCGRSGTNIDMNGTPLEKQAGCDGLADTFPGQDGMQGRDARSRDAALGGEPFPKTGDGAAGFDFTKVCNSGEAAGEGDCPADPALGDNANDWACTRDNVTGLIWEVKVDDVAHLRHMAHTYSWYNTDAATNGGSAGSANAGTCTGSDCDTQAFVQAVNALAGSDRLCGASDWRMPSDVELQSIVDYGRTNPAIDASYFPNTPANEAFWSASPRADDSSLAWGISFSNGGISEFRKNYSVLSVRLVHTGQ